MKLLSPRLPVTYVDSVLGLEKLKQLLGATNFPVGIDAERASGFRYSQAAYLVQIAIQEQGIFLIDPIGIRDSRKFRDFAEVLSQKTWILHAATQDIPCLIELGIKASKLFDTELAAKICGLERVGLSSVTQTLLELELEKEHSASDWSIRPLTEAMLNYAALDVDVLHELWGALTSKLDETGRQEWAKQEMEHLVAFRPKQVSEEPWRNLPGVSKFKEMRQLQIAASLWLARDEIAKAEDIAPGRLIPDRSISAAATAVPKSKSELLGLKDFNGRAAKKLLNTWWKAIVESESLQITLKLPQDPNHIPNHRNWERKFPHAHKRYEQTRPRILALASELGIPQEVLVSPEVIRRICFGPELDIKNQLQTLGARPWQIELVEPILTESLVLEA